MAIKEKQTISIAEARDKFTSVIRAAEESNQGISVTRRGKTVAVILSADNYERLLNQRKNSTFSDAYDQFLKAFTEDVEPDIVWEIDRPQTSGREETIWE